MTFADVLTYLKNIPSKDVFALINDLEGGLIYLADKCKIPSMIFFIAGIALALIIGLATFKLARPTLIIVGGFFGIMAGSALFYELWAKFTWMPAWLCYVFCILGAAILLCITVGKPSGALAFYVGLLGYLAAFFYLSDVIVSLAIAFVCTLIASLFPRVCCICISSFVGGLLTVGFLSMLLPKVNELRFGNSWTAITIALVITVAYALVQFANSRYDYEEI